MRILFSSLVVKHEVGPKRVGVATSGVGGAAKPAARFVLVRLHAKAFGGGTIIDTDGGSLSIGMRNANFAKEWLAREGIPLKASDFLGPWSRKIIFLPFNGEAFCKRLITNMANAEVIAREERAYAQTLLQKPKSVENKIELF